MVAALKEVAENDPSPEVQGHSIRKSAMEALTKIQQNTWALCRLRGLLNPSSKIVCEGRPFHSSPATYNARKS